jgi:hypothetical protein
MKTFIEILTDILKENDSEKVNIGFWVFANDLAENLQKTVYQLTDMEIAFKMGENNGKLKKPNNDDYSLPEDILMHTSKEFKLELEYIFWKLLKNACEVYVSQFYSYHDLYMAFQAGNGSHGFMSLNFANWISTYGKSYN